MNGKITLSVLGIASLFLLGSWVGRPEIAVQVPPSDTPIVTPVGAVSTPDFLSNHYSVGGLRAWKYKYTLRTATTTVCAIQSPAATSTLKSAGIRLDTSSTTASIVVAAKSATAFATTTFLFGGNVAANAKTATVATTTTNNFVFGPSQWLVMSMQGGAGTFSPVGICQAEFEDL